MGIAEPALPPPADDPVAAELAVWKQARRRPPFPWRSFALMLGVCSTVAAFALPDSVNDAIGYLLYAIAGIGFFSGLAGRRKKPS